MATPYSQATAIKAALINTFTTNQGPSGKLAPVLSIGPTSFPESGVYPYCGLDIIQMNEAFVANHKIRLTIDFGISISVKTNTLLQDAYTIRDSIIDDGEGNGVQPILRSLMYTLLDGLIEKCEIGKTIFINNVEDDKSAAPTVFYADAVILFTVNQTINV